MLSKRVCVQCVERERKWELNDDAVWEKDRAANCPFRLSKADRLNMHSASIDKPPPEWCWFKMEQMLASQEIKNV